MSFLLRLLKFFAMLSISLSSWEMLGGEIYRSRLLAKKIPEWMKPAVTNIKNKTEVPIIIPTLKPTEQIKIIAGSEAKRQSYEIYYGTNLSCTSSKCSFGRTGGEIITKKTKDYDREYRNFLITVPEIPRNRTPTFKNISEKGGYVVLSRKIKGFFIPSHCYSYCNGAAIYWRQGKYQYFVAYRPGGSLKELIEFANSAIDNQH